MGNEKEISFSLPLRQSLYKEVKAPFPQEIHTVYIINTGLIRTYLP